MARSTTRCATLSKLANAWSAAPVARLAKGLTAGDDVPSSSPLPALILLASATAGCADPTFVRVETPLLATNVCTAHTGEIALRVNVRDPSGNAIDLVATGATVSVETRRSGAPWSAAASVVFDPTTHPSVDVALVVDNSGSESGSLQLEKDAITLFADRLLFEGSGSRAGLVRVSTHSEAVQELTTEPTALHRAVDLLFIGDGWTALWDGFRVGNELVEAAPVPEATHLLRCAQGPFPTLIGFTDGRDNNSADEKSDPAKGDGIDTTPDDLRALAVDDVPTEVTTIGVGDDLDEAALASLSQNGGRYTHIDSYDQLVDELGLAADLLANSTSVTFTPDACDQDQGRVFVTYNASGLVETVQAEFTLPANYCP